SGVDPWMAISFLINDRECASSTLRRCGAGTRYRDARKSVFPGGTFEALTADARPRMIGKPIFFDPTGKRGRVLRGLAWAMGTLSAIVFVMFAVTLVVVHR